MGRKLTLFVSLTVSCIHARHDVRQKRDIKGEAKSLSSKKDRLDRYGKDEEEGLTLGSGLEWSGWRGGLGRRM